MEKLDVVIIGAGAAGLMCAMRAGQRGKRVLLLDHAEKVGAKILISGGGRCNFTNVNTAPDRFFSDNPHFCKSALKRYTPADFIALVTKHGIAYHTKTLGQLFCDSSARDIVAMLLTECEAAGVEIKLNCKISDIVKVDDFRVETDQGNFVASNVVLATGGLSIPKMGATDFTYRMAKRFGVKLTDIRPALVPLTLDQDKLLVTEPLSGVALEVVAQLGKYKFRENMLFTHRGISGPAILQISSCWKEGDTLTLNLLPDISAADYLVEHKKLRPKAEIKTILGQVLPQRLARVLVEGDHAEKPIGTLPDKELHKLAARINGWHVTPAGSEGYAKAEVTLGGIATTTLSSKTMMANDVPGLYVIGEAVDVTGWLGGYNFQWAWASGWCAAESI